ncbi:MAG TPA: STAS domain-containing protein [Gaiellaceae bacterium]|nr:STAS domain-containing protein [Gaiellaceae bacterium]
MRSDGRGFNARIEAPTVISRIDVAQLGATRYVLTVGADADACAVKDALYPLSAHEGASVVVDVQALPVVDPSLLGILTGAAHLVRAAGGELVIVTRSPRVRWLLDDSGLTQVARVERTLNHALAIVA